MSSHTGDDAGRAAATDLARRALAQLPGGSLVLSGDSRSMVPTLRGGEVLHWRRLGRPPRAGEILVYHLAPGAPVPDHATRPRTAEPVSPLRDAVAGQKLVVHRVAWHRRDRSLRTKGDGRPLPDVEPVTSEAALGLVEAIERAGRRYELAGRRARAYAFAVLGLSLAGAGLFQLASWGDAVLRRIVPPLGPRWVLRAPAWWVQRGAQEVFRALLFRLAHPSGPSPGAGPAAGAD
jgi:hypothetical protein